MSSLVIGSTRGWAVVHSFMKLRTPSPPNAVPGTSSVDASPSALQPSNQPTVSSPGRDIRMGGPLSQVARARPSWYKTPVFATLIFLMTCCEPGRFERRTRKMVRRIRRIMRNKEEAGLTRVAMLGRIGSRSVGVVIVERYASVRMYWFTNSGCMEQSFCLRNATPLSIPSPSNQCASLPRSSFVTGFPPLRTYSPPASSSGIDPVYEQGISGCTRFIGAKFPWRYG